MWRFEHTEETTATREALWERYADPPGWPEWDQETAEVTLDGAFARHHRVVAAGDRAPGALHPD